MTSIGYILTYSTTPGIKKMERYGLKELQSDLRTVLGNGLTEDNVQSVKDVMSRYKSDPQDWKEKEKWSDVK